jgi:hypothetical protein
MTARDVYRIERKTPALRHGIEASPFRVDRVIGGIVSLTRTILSAILEQVF